MLATNPKKSGKAVKAKKKLAAGGDGGHDEDKIENLEALFVEDDI